MGATEPGNLITSTKFSTTVLCVVGPFVATSFLAPSTVHYKRPGQNPGLLLRFACFFARVNAQSAVSASFFAAAVAVAVAVVVLLCLRPTAETRELVRAAEYALLLREEVMTGGYYFPCIHRPRSPRPRQPGGQPARCTVHVVSSRAGK